MTLKAFPQSFKAGLAAAIEGAAANGHRDAGHAYLASGITSPIIKLYKAGALVGTGTFDGAITTNTTTHKLLVPSATITLTASIAPTDALVFEILKSDGSVGLRGIFPTDAVLSAPVSVGVGMGSSNPHYSFPLGWASTVGGFGGTVLKVTNTNASGSGSFKAALDTPGARVIVFETSGVIDMAGALWTVTEPFLTVAGQTAPSPGITLIKGSVDIKTHDVIWQHTRIRPGTGAGTDRDAIQALDGAYDVIIDHNSLSWGTDEIMSAGGYPFDGSTIEDFRANSAHRITFSHNICAEALTSESGYGTLVEDNATEILFYGNLWAHNPERTPNFGGGAQGSLINNLIYNPGGKHIDYTFLNSKWDSEGGGLRVNGKITAIGNVMLDGPNSSTYAVMTAVSNGNVDYYGYDNIALRVDGVTAIPAIFNSTFLSPQGIVVVASTPPVTAPGVTIRSASTVEEYTALNVGARPWDRDVHDLRVLSHLANRNGAHIADEDDVGGYPASVENTLTFVEANWDMTTMEPVTPPSGELVYTIDDLVNEMTGTNDADPGAMVNLSNWGARLFHGYVFDGYPGGGTTIFPWFEFHPAHPTVSPWTAAASNSRVAIRNFRVFRRESNSWVLRLQRNTSAGWWGNHFYHKASYGSPTRDHTPTNTSNGIAQPADQMGFSGDEWIWHGFMDNGVSSTGSTGEVYAVCLDARIELIDPNGTDDRANVKLLGHVAADWYGSSGIISEAFHARVKYLTSNWQRFGCVNITTSKSGSNFPGALTEAQLRANPPSAMLTS